MAIEFIDVVDTAVKIGLGASITGIFTFLGVRQRHKSEQLKFVLEHKIKIIEEIYSEAETYLSAWNALIFRLAGTLKKLEHDAESIVLNTSQIKGINAIDNELRNTMKLRRSVLAKLRLLKADDAIEVMKDIINLEGELREKLFFEKKYPNYNNFIVYRKKAFGAQNDFHKKLADVYERITQ
ncbi:hypothetical protein ACET8V_01215 [Aeromonas veronii]